jgi:hypothetical protein
MRDPPGQSVHHTPVEVKEKKKKEKKKGRLGIWVGLTAALILIGVALLWVWREGVRSLAA